MNPTATQLQRILWQPRAGSIGAHWRAFSGSERFLVLLFLLTLPLVNPWVHGDGVGYYAYVRSVLINHTLRFEEEWLAGNPTFVGGRVDHNGQLRADQYTSTGYVDNHFSVGPSMLWAPFLLVTHLIVLSVNRLGAHIPADGFSRPYLVAMAVATASYGFAGLCLAFGLARKYFEERWALLATLGIWFASSLPVYMYFNPSRSHAHSAFAVSLFLWYWHRTRGERTLGQWMLLGGLSGLMVNVYYPNALLLVILGSEALTAYGQTWRREQDPAAVRRLLGAHTLYAAATAVALLPTLVTRWVIYGNPFRLGYREQWFWGSPALKDVLFSSNHGLLSWTPILIPALLGLLLFWKRDRVVAGYLLAAFVAFYYFIASYRFWHGLSSYGNRFFVSLTPLFILGLAASLECFSKLFARQSRAFVAALLVTGLFVLWNVGFVFQWGTLMVPPRGLISWPKMIHNQVVVVPGKMFPTLKSYLLARGALMVNIEQMDLYQLKRREAEGH